MNAADDDVVMVPKQLARFTWPCGLLPKSGATADAGCKSKTSNMSKQSWLERFHSGDRELMRTVYVEHVALVSRAVAAYLASADQETVTHEVSFRLLTDPQRRANFAGGICSLVDPGFAKSVHRPPATLPKGTTCGTGGRS